MQITYDPIVIPDRLRMYVREIASPPVQDVVPPGWSGIIVYHPATNQYYSSKTVRPFDYFNLLRSRQPEKKWEDLAVSLKQMLAINHTFQFFVLHTKSRDIVEGWMAEMGKRRISTRMGDTATQEHILFKVYSPFNKVTRYITAPLTTPHEKIIAQANTSISTWLKSHSRMNQELRKNMRVALRCVFGAVPVIFEPESVVSSTNKLVGKKHNEFRAITTHENLQAMMDFARATQGG
jgi:hypothetical protein